MSMGMRARNQVSAQKNHGSTQSVSSLCRCMLPLLGSPLHCSHPLHSVCLTCIEGSSMYSNVASGLQIMRRASLLGMQLAGLGTLQTATSKPQADWQLYPASSHHPYVVQPVLCQTTTSSMSAVWTLRATSDHGVDNVF